MMSMLQVANVTPVCTTCVHQVALSELLFVADNLAYFSYQQLDEPLFVMNQIDIIVSTSGVPVLEQFTEVTVTIPLEMITTALSMITVICIIVLGPDLQKKLKKIPKFSISFS